MLESVEAAVVLAAAVAEVQAVVVTKVAALTTALRAETVLLLSLLTLHLTLIQIQIQIQMTNSLMHYPIPIVLNVKSNIWVLILIIVT